MKFSTMIKLIKKKTIVKNVNIAKDDEFIDIALLDSNIFSYSEDFLYIGHITQLNNIDELPKFLLYLDDDICDSDINLTNYAKIDQKDFALVFNTIREELMRSIKAEKAYTKMLQMILDGRGLSAILDELEEKTGNAIAVLDITGKIIANSRPFEVPDPLWIQSVERGYCPYEFMEHLGKLRSKNISPKTTEAFVSFCEDTSLTYLCSKILSKDYLLGYVFMFKCKKSFDQQDRQLLPMISNVTSEMLLRGNDNVSLRSQLYSNILVDMLKGIDPIQASIRIQNSELSFFERMKVLYVQPSYYHGEGYIKDELHTSLVTIFSKAPSLYYKKGIVLIASVNENHQINEALMKELKALVKRQHVKVGVSNSFTDPALFARYYHQAEDALRFARMINMQDGIHYYHNFAFFDMISELPIELHLGKYCHPALARLRQYDHERNTELYRTLKILAETGFNQRKTAELMYIHRNTLNYRKKRIEEVGGINLDDHGLLFQLLYSFEIDSFLENRNH